ncbi:MAG: AraC family transcriptional regulator [Cytophagales bacterium]|nr:MAG: AraC family transcriptional regulator [Cytophagales bacterium]
MSIILQIFHIISQNNSSSRVNTCSSIARGITQSKESNTKRMTNIIEFTRENFRNKISIEDISAIANLSSSAFCRYFKKEKDKNYTDYVNELRIMYASNLLKSTEISVTQIVYESGFENPSHFFSLFKKITKKTPLQYRKIQTEMNLK